MTLEIFNIPRYWALTYIPERDWICSRIPIVPKAKWICFRERTYSNDIHSVLSSHVETVVLLSHKNADTHINVNVEFGEGDGKIPVGKIAEKAEEYRPSGKK